MTQHTQNPTPQNPDQVLDHLNLFRHPDYVTLFKNKRCEFERAAPDEKVEEIREWTKTWDYREKNLSREALAINPDKACQPTGAIMAAVGFEGTLPFVHGSQGCVAYYRTYFNRHFKEPSSVVSTSMTEDAAVFGGLNNLVDGLANAYNLYQPKMIAVLTTCMAEVIGDDLNAFIKVAKDKGSVPHDFNTPFAHTPAFVGSHITGYDNMMKGILSYFWDGKAGTVPPLERKPTETINFIGGFDGYVVGNLREIKRIFSLFGAEAIILSDSSEVWDTPTDGQFRMYDGGTTVAETEAALNSKATLVMQEFGTEKTREYLMEKGQEVISFNYPIGVSATDEFLMAISRLTGKPIPKELEKERGRLVDAIADSVAHIHGKKFALSADPSMAYGLTRFLLELGAQPLHIMATNGNKEWEAKMKALLDSSPFGQGCHVWAGKDLWHMRSFLFTEPVDFLIGNCYCKYLERDTGTPLIRIGFPIFDRHHHHRFPTWGYQGGLNVLVRILDKIFDEMDRNTIGIATSDYSFDLIR
ncbi:MAG: nitrogenase molybdenum-iron protein subunit beta [Methylohalobius sp.]|nr:nitrogenase molybdenum-iron protein subunit beta [Methylohalobius sp.]